MVEKYFILYDSARMAPYYGPHYVIDVEAGGGKKLYHSLEELLKMSFSDALKQRLASARLGTAIKVHYLHSNGNLMLKRIDAEDTQKLDKLAVLMNEVQELVDKIEEKKKEQKLLFNSVKK